MRWPLALGLLPYGVIAGAVLAVLLAISVRRRHSVVAGLTAGGLATAAAAFWTARRLIPMELTGLFRFDDLAVWFSGVIVVCALGAVLLAHGYLERRRVGRPEELYALLLLATLGSVLLAASDHLASIFLALETLSISLYGMIGYFRRDRLGIEAAMKYFIPAAAASALFLFGAGLLYGETGSLDLASIQRAGGPVARAGTLLVLSAFAFKLALVPFHMWTPDVYQGAPAPVSAFVATVSKGGAIAFLVRFTALAEVVDGGAVVTALSILAVLSIVTGNLLALMQRSLKRILAYSSIAHLGYLLVALVAGAFGAVRFYFAAYALTTLLAFGVVTVLSGEVEADDLESYRGLMWQRPLLVLPLGVAAFSLAGVPITAGFFAKLYVVTAGAAASRWMLLFVLVLGSAAGLVYYLRVLVATFAEATSVGPPGRRIARPSAGVLIAATLLVVGLGLFPEVIGAF